MAIKLPVALVGPFRPQRRPRRRLFQPAVLATLISALGLSLTAVALARLL